MIPELDVVGCLISNSKPSLSFGLWHLESLHSVAKVPISPDKTPLLLTEGQEAESQLESVLRKEKQLWAKLHLLNICLAC